MSKRNWLIAGAVVVLGLVVTLGIVKRTPALHTEEAVAIAVDAYIYGYPLVTLDMARRQQTNVAAADGEKGLVLAVGSAPDIILLDIMLPKMNGFEVLEKLKADKRTVGIPVLLLTNLNQKNEVERGLALGAEDYLIKAHFMPSEVVTKIKKILSM